MISTRHADLLDIINGPLAYINITHERVGMVKELVTVHLILKTDNVAKRQEIVDMVEDAHDSLPTLAKNAYNRDSGYVRFFPEVSHVLSYECIHGIPSSEFIVTHFVRSLGKHGAESSRVNEHIGDGAAVVEQMTIYPKFLKTADLLDHLKEYATIRIWCDMSKPWSEPGVYTIIVDRTRYRNHGFGIIDEAIRNILIKDFGFKNNSHESYGEGGLTHYTNSSYNDTFNVLQEIQQTMPKKLTDPSAPAGQRPTSPEKVITSFTSNGNTKEVTIKIELAWPKPKT